MPCKLDHETIDAYALGKLRDSEVEAHLHTCPKCRERVAEARNWDKFVRRAKKRLIEVAPVEGDK
jgi:anti-sigma factor RsiW